MTASTVGMVGVTLALTVFAGPIYDLCENIGEALLTPMSIGQLEQDVEP